MVRLRFSDETQFGVSPMTSAGAGTDTAPGCEEKETAPERDGLPRVFMQKNRNPQHTAPLETSTNKTRFPRTTAKKFLSLSWTAARDAVFVDAPCPRRPREEKSGAGQSVNAFSLLSPVLSPVLFSASFLFPLTEGTKRKPRATRIAVRVLNGGNYGHSQ